MVRSAFDLSQGIMDAGQTYGTVGDGTSLASATNILSFLPGVTTKIIPRDNSPKKKGSTGETYDNRNNWLTVDHHRTMVVFLVYSSTLNVFDQNVWNLVSRSSKALTGTFTCVYFDMLKIDSKCIFSLGTLLEYVTENVVDMAVIDGAKTPTNCQIMHDFFKPIVGSIVATPCPAIAPTVLSVSRCGLRFNKFAFDVWKGGKPTPGLEVC